MGLSEKIIFNNYITAISGKIGMYKGNSPINQAGKQDVTLRQMMEWNAMREKTRRCNS
jgi:hypothetical protein